MAQVSRAADAAVALGELSSRGGVRVRSRARRFYLAITLILIAIVVRGFWPSYFGPLFAAMAFDVFTRGRPHPVHFVSVAVLTVAFGRIFFMESEGWLKIGRVLLVSFV